jgi:hypothetical protein
MAWSKQKIADFTVQVKRGRSDVTFSLQSATTFKLGVIKQFIDKKIKWSTVVLEAINFLNHLFSVGPTKSLIPVGRKFFTDEKSSSESKYLEYRSGLFQAVHFGGETSLTLNVNVTTGVFWNSDIVTALDLVSQYLNIAKHEISPSRINEQHAKRLSRVLKGLKFRVNHRGPEHAKRSYTVSRLSSKSASQHTFPLTKATLTKTVSVQEYFRSTYNIKLKYPEANLIMKGDTHFPLELCMLVPVPSPIV